jgi:hypothetical protein
MFAVVGVSCKLFFSIFVPWPCGFINLKLGTLCLLFKKENDVLLHPALQLTA